MIFVLWRCVLRQVKRNTKIFVLACCLAAQLPSRPAAQLSSRPAGQLPTTSPAVHPSSQPVSQPAWLPASPNCPQLVAPPGCPPAHTVRRWSRRLAARQPKLFADGRAASLCPPALAVYFVTSQRK